MMENAIIDKSKKPILKKVHSVFITFGVLIIFLATIGILLFGGFSFILTLIQKQNLIEAKVISTILVLVVGFFGWRVRVVKRKGFGFIQIMVGILMAFYTIPASAKESPVLAVVSFIAAVYVVVSGLGDFYHDRKNLEFSLFGENQK